ncbi:MAG: chloride channel protein [Actinomycetota bacterium]
MRSSFARSKDLASALGVGVGVGCVGGFVAYAFLKVLDWSNDTRIDNEWIIFFLPIAGLVIGLAFHYVGSSVRGGSNLVLEEIHEPGGGVPRRMAPFVFVATAISHLFGASTGREGAGIQITASVTDALSRMFKPSKEIRRVLLITSIAAAFGGLFGVPVGGVIFALEVQENGRIRYEAILPALVAGFTSFFLVEWFGFDHIIEPAVVAPSLSWALLGQLLILALVAAAIGRVFIFLTHLVHRTAERLVSYPPLRPFFGGLIVLGLTALAGTRDYLGLSQPLAKAAFVGGAGLVAGAFLWKLLFTSVSLGTGFIGGEMVPLFIMGALAGSQVASIFDASPALFAAVGMMATFSAAANTPLACVVIGVELFGSSPIVALTITCIVAYVVSGRAGIYHSQRHAFQNTN